MSRLSYLSVKNITDTTADIYFYGEIVGDEWDKWCDTDTCPQDVIDALKAAENRDVNIFINSPGGNVFAGVAIYNMLIRHQGKRTVYIDGVAASIASVIAMCGDRIVMPSNSCLMIHNPMCLTYGNAEELRKMADNLDTITSPIVETYRTKLKDGVSDDEIRQMMNEETWLTALDTTKYFNVEITTGNAAVAKADFEKICQYKNIPENIKNSIQQEIFKNQEETKTKLMLELELLGM